MKRISGFFKGLFTQSKKEYVAPGFISVDNSKKERYSFSDSWCFASESK